MLFIWCYRFLRGHVKAAHLSFSENHFLLSSPDRNYVLTPIFFFYVTGVLISRLSIQRVLDVSAEWTADSNRSDHSSVQYDFRVTCDAHYYGSGCANLCRPRDDQFGHYTCSETGDIVCLAGWQGEYCTKGKYMVFYCPLYNCNRWFNV